MKLSLFLSKIPPFLTKKAIFYW